MVDLDQSGHGFSRVRTYLGPSLGWAEEYVQPTTDVTVSGVYDVKPGDSVLLVDVVAGPIQINLPDVTQWMQQKANQPATGFDRSITIKDLGGNAANFNIVIAPFGQQAIDNVQQAILISTNRAAVRLSPLIDMSGWIVETASTSGGGGSGGDVFKAGNNTYTGINTFNNIVTAPTPSIADDSQNVATTEFVKDQAYITGASLLPYAPLFSPTFTGTPTAPTPTPPTDDSTRLATTEFVNDAIAAVGTPAPINAEYVTSIANAALTAERVITDSASILWDRTTPGQIKANTAAGGGNVSNSGTPNAGELAEWVTTTTIRGITKASLGYAPLASPAFTGTPTAPTPTPQSDNSTKIATTAFVKAEAATKQPLDGDLTAISALAGTNTIYYRSGVDLWSPVTFSGLSFSGGVLTVTAGGGNVSNSGTPVNGQLAGWTSATAIQGITLGTALSLAATTLNVTLGSGGAQAWDADLDSLAAASATNVIYYRSAANTWSTVTIGSGLTFSGGTLSSAAGGGNVSNSGTPTAGQVAVWTNATTIQGVASSSFGFAPIANPVFTGDPQAPTPGTSDNDTSIATTAYVKNQGYAPLASPVFTGDARAPTPLAGDNDTSLATTAFVQAAVSGLGLAAPQGRLSLQSNFPVVAGNISTSTNIFYIPYLGNRLPIYDGTTMIMTQFSQLTAVTTDATKSPAAIGASKVNDWFVWNDAGTIRLSHGPDWTSLNARSAGTAIVRVNGIWTNAVAITNGPGVNRGTYVGTTLSDGTSRLNWVRAAAGAGGSFGMLYVWNAYNRVMVGEAVKDTGSAYTYASGAIRAARGTPTPNGMAVNFVLGFPDFADEPVIANYIQRIDLPSIGNIAAISIGFDSVVSPQFARTFVQGVMAGNATKISNHAEWHQSISAPGYHFVVGLESSDVGTNTFNPDVDSTLFVHLFM